MIAKISFSFITKYSSLSILMESINYLIWIKDDLGRYIQVNQSYATFCGKTIEEMLGSTDIDIWGPQLDKKPFIDNFVPDKINVVKIERQLIEHPIYGKQYFNVMVAPILKVNGSNLLVTVGIAINVTDQIDKENIARAAIKEIQNQLELNELIK
jgi:PAS domain S-box-containing protein